MLKAFPRGCPCWSLQVFALQLGFPFLLTSMALFSLCLYQPLLLWGWSRAKVLAVAGRFSSILQARSVIFIYIWAYNVRKHHQRHVAVLQVDPGLGQKPSLENPTSACCGSEQGAGSERWDRPAAIPEGREKIKFKKKRKSIGNAQLQYSGSRSELSRALTLGRLTAL